MRRYAMNKEKKKKKKLYTFKLLGSIKYGSLTYLALKKFTVTITALYFYFGLKASLKK